jgi:hypothetical protein
VKGILSKIFSTGATEFAEGVAGIVDRFVTTPDERAEAQRAILELAEQRDQRREESARQTMQSRERVLVAELQQGDSYTKRARPSVVYVGLGVAVLQGVVTPWIEAVLRAFSDADFVMPAVSMPVEFWAGWAGIVATWSIGRSMEKRGAGNNVAGIITGSTGQRDRVLSQLGEPL